MSFLNSISQLVSGAGQSINASARKLVSSLSQDSTSGGSLSEFTITPNIEVSTEDEQRAMDSLLGTQQKRPTGPMLIPSPEMVASMPLSPGVHFSRRRPSLGLSPSTAVNSSSFNALGKRMLDPPIANLGPLSSPASPAKAGNTCGAVGRGSSTGSIGTPRRSSFRESFKIKDGNENNGGASGSRRQSIVQLELIKQKPKLATKLLPRYTDMPQMWAEVSDTQKQVSRLDNEFLEFYGSLQLHHESKKRQYFDNWKSIDDKPPTQSSLGIEPVIPQVATDEHDIETDEAVLSTQQKEDLYKEVLYTITHKLGASGSAGGNPNLASINHLRQLQAQKKPNALSAALAPIWHTAVASNEQESSEKLSKEELYKYAQKAFGINDETHDRLMEEVKEEKPPIVILNVTVVEADNLEAKDSNGTSDPFCMLGIRPGESITPTRSPRDKSPNAGPRHHRGANAAASDFGEPGEDGDRVGALPETLAKPTEKLSRKTGSFRLSFKRRDTKKAKNKDATIPACLTIQSSQGLNHQQNGTVMLEPSSPLPGNAPMPAKFIRATSVKPKTLSPKWHERFRLPQDTIFVDSPFKGESMADFFIAEVTSKGFFLLLSDCDDAATDYLHLDIWDHDDEASVMDAVKKLNEVKGMKGLGRYFKQVAQSARSDGGQDDFLGSIDIPVREVPVQGLDKWYRLEGRTQRSNIQGSIHLKMWLASRENRGFNEEEGMWNEIWQHQQLYTIFLRHHVMTKATQLESNSINEDWNGQLAEAATAILQQHAIQGDLTELQVIALRWRALAQQAKDERQRIHFKVVFEALKDLEKHWDRDLLTNDEERALGEALCYFVEYGLLLLQHHRKLFTPKNKVAFEKLDYLLRSFHLLSEMKVTATCYPPGLEMKQEVVGAIKKSITSWVLTKLDTESLEERLVQREPLSGAEYRALLNKINDILIDINAHLESCSRHYNALFERTLGINFIGIVYKQYDKMISEEICPVLTRIIERDMSLDSADLLLPPPNPQSSIEEGAGDDSTDFKESAYDEEKRERQRKERKCHCKSTKELHCRHFLTFDLFEVCLALREVHAKRKNLNPLERRSLQFSSSYHDWFMPPFAAWLAVVSEQLPRRVAKAVECEKLVSSILHADLKHATSCRDVTSSFYHIKDLWNQMGWQEVHNNRPILAASVDIICKNATLYTDMVLKSNVENRKLYAEDEKSFAISETFCVAMNNIEHVCQCVMTVPHEFSFYEDRASVSSTSSNEFVATVPTGLDTNDHLLEFVITTVDQIDLAIYNALEPMAGKLQPAMKKHIFHLAWSPESLPTVDAISPLLSFLDARLQDFNGRFLKGNVIRCLHIMWESVLNEIADHVKSNASERNPAFYDRLYEALHLLIEWFAVDGKGLTGDKLQTENYTKMELLYGLNKMTTGQLIDLYHRERLNDQHVMLQQYQAYGDSPPYGILCVRVYYRNECLFVEVINARDVIPLDNNGLSDPFVIVELLPKRVFQCAEQQTHVQKSTLQPIFDECFEFPAYGEQLLDEDAMLLFSLYDHDVITCNDFGGEAFFPLKDVPGVTPRGRPTVGNFHGLKQMELALMFQENTDHPVLQVLSERQGDKMAQDFVKKQKQRFPQ